MSVTVRKIEPWVFLVTILSVAVAGCQEQATHITGPRPNPKTQLNSITNLAAYSASDTSVGLTWTLSTSEGVDGFNNYLITAQTQDGAVVSRTTAPEGASGAVIDSLTEGVVYLFQVIATALSDSSQYYNSVPRIIRWAPAWRFDSLRSGRPINVYETTDSNGLHSGLIFFDAASRWPKVVSITTPGVDSLSIDLYVRTETNRRVSIKSASVLHPNWRRTKFTANTVVFSNSLDTSRFTPPDTSQYSATSIMIDSAATPKSIIYYFKTASGNYGRLFLERNPENGTLIWGRSPAQYLSMKISYQELPNNRYCKTVYSGFPSGGE